jgi:hypothetical protein
MVEAGFKPPGMKTIMDKIVVDDYGGAGQFLARELLDYARPFLTSGAALADWSNRCRLRVRTKPLRHVASICTSTNNRSTLPRQPGG